MEVMKQVHATDRRGAEESMKPKNTVRIMCPSLTCRTVLAVPESARGKTVRCKSCGAAVLVPPASSTATDAKKAG